LISSQIDALANQIGDMDNKADAYRSLNRQLHTEIRRAARSPSLAEIVESLGDRSDFYIAFFRNRVFALNLKIAHSEHEKVIAAIVARDPRQARIAMKRHIRATEKRLEENFVDA
jgi:DNA-binding GntR family transcriptional regulator